MSQNVLAGQGDALTRAADRLVITISHRWLLFFLIIYGVFISLPWLAPVLMNAGYERLGRMIHMVYSVVCHQLPERSFFLSGPETMYSAEAIDRVWPYYGDIATWRQFIGTPDMGWKVAWSDRMVSMYGSVWLGAVLFAFVRRRLRPLRFKRYLILALPMVIDGFTHMINDLFGLSFRQTNGWLASLTDNVLPATFYAGDALGSFNSWLRLITGVIFGLSTVWMAFPLIERAFRDIQRNLSRDRVAAG